MDAKAPVPEADTGLSGEELAALTERFAAVAPLLKAFFPESEKQLQAVPPASAGGTAGPPPGPAPSGVGPPGKRSQREALLLALKPYLSPERREMADYLVRLCRLYESFRGIF